MQAVVFGGGEDRTHALVDGDGRRGVLAQPLAKHHVQGEGSLHELLVGFQFRSRQVQVPLGPGRALLLQSVVAGHCLQAGGEVIVS